MNPNKALWEKGDFTEIAALMRQSGEALVASLGVTPQLRVLDLGCGDGTTAVPLACLGAEVVGIDIARNLVEAGNKRAAEAGLHRLKFQEGDACNLEGVLKISSAYTPPPPEGFVSPMTWGVDTHIIDRFTQAGVPKENISMVKDTFHFASPDKGPEDLIESFRRYYGPTMNAYDAAEKNGKVDELHNQLLELARSENTSTNGGTSIPATFLRVTVLV
jgi:SAM-dependent methyltransferase